MRNHSIDSFRFLAAFGVILIHLAPSTEAAGWVTLQFWYFAVPFFLLVSLFYFAQRAGKNGGSVFGGFKVFRILVPYAAWTAIYFLMQLIKARMTQEVVDFNWIAVVFYGAGAVHLYFLPLLVFFQIQYAALAMLVAGWKKRDWRTLFTALGILIALVLFAQLGEAVSTLGWRNSFVKGLVYCFGTFALVKAYPRLAERRGYWPAAFACFGVILVFLAANLSGVNRLSGELIAPVLALLIACLAIVIPPWPAPAWVKWILGTTYGIYLAHFGFLEVFEFLFEELGVQLTPYSLITKIWFSCAIVVFCLGFVACVRLIPRLRFILLGERP